MNKKFNAHSTLENEINLENITSYEYFTVDCVNKGNFSVPLKMVGKLSKEL